MEEKISKNIYNLPFNKKIKPLPQPAPWHKENKWLKNALDFAMPEGTPIFAAERGKVYLVINKHTKNYKEKSFADLCNNIIIKHPNEEYTEYVHLKKGIKLKKGDLIKKGQPIGYSGLTGYSTYSHLHFAVIKFNGTWETIVPKIKIGTKVILMKSPDNLN